MSDLYKKYIVKKRDGSKVDPNAQYFVLRLDTDRAAQVAALAYADAIQKTDPNFALDLRVWVGHCGGAVEHRLHTDSGGTRLKLVRMVNSLSNMLIDAASKGYVSSDDLDFANDCLDTVIPVLNAAAGEA